MTPRLVLFGVAAILARAAAVNLLVVYDHDAADHTKSLAEALAVGCTADAVGCVSRVLPVESANYARDVSQWADAVALGSGVYNGNAAPALLSFVNSWDVDDARLGSLLGASFATGAAAAAGLQPVLEELNRALLTFGVMLVGGGSWQNGEGTGSVVADGAPVGNASLQLARAHGLRLATAAAAMKRGRATQPPPPPPPPRTPSAPVARVGPPGWGERWSAQISANLTQVGYDAGLVIVNFTTACGADPGGQKSRTVYGDAYTVLTRCDLGHEFIVAPASRGSGCTVRTIGVDADARVCEACGCPFCVRDTNGSYTHGQKEPGTTAWDAPYYGSVGGETLTMWRGTARGRGADEGGFALTTELGFRADGTPAHVNVSHPLWVATKARIDNFVPTAPDSAFDVPPTCHLPRAVAL